MTELAIKADGLGKKYKIGASVAQHDSVRDMLQSVGKKLLKPNKQKESGEFWALRNASFEINRGENVGIIGLNGAGKSTLLKILSQIVTPTEGHATIQGRLGALLEVGTGFHQELTGRENVFLYGSILGMSREEVEQKFDRIVDFSEIADFIDTPVKRYSSGMYVRLAFAVAAHLDPDILLLDEVLAVGDFSFQKKCMDFAKSLEKQGSTILFVSHNMFSIKTMCPRVIYLKKGEVVFDGPTDEGLRIYEADSRLAQSPWFQSEGGQAPAITFTDIQLLDRSGTEKTVFEFGEQMTVRIRYQTSRAVQKPDIRIGINRADEIHCCSFSTSSDEIDLPMIDGEGEIEMVTPALELVSDQYTTTIAVRENDHQICSQLGATFHIRHPVYQSNAFGVFHQSGEWRLNAMKNGLAQTTVAKAE
ncbi:ABC transporter ATP-binding protein [Hyphomonas oceanitis]|uniref:ABC transporter ATP-binding protein n=1 Tax=Hyphomonas oceanitis TaxID=81033 RepID=UPI003002566D